MSGTITFDKTFKQLIQEKNKVETRIKDPLGQVKRQRFMFSQWLDVHNFPPHPSDFLVVFTHPDAILKTNTPDHPDFKKVLHVENLLETIDSIETRHEATFLEKHTFYKIKKLLLSKHTPLEQNLLEVYRISATELIRGVQCERCSSFSMKRIRKAWECPHCHHRSQNSHERALIDYFLLVAPYITNRECRDFLKIDSSDTVRRLLLSLGLTTDGQNKGTRYYFNEKLFKSRM